MADNENKELTGKKASEPAKKPARKPFFKRVFGRIAKWFREMKSELKKVVWPSRKDVTKNTIVALVVMIIAAVVIWCFDRVSSLAVQLLISLTN